ncbi:MAG: type II toxin-antitoxin system Phd/YefM family antitoxin [Acidobacteria bacterium]|nr:type II toxin-antitoxin system Phd/YefM family antitoxin [Acidobacteriota bacterium]
MAKGQVITATEFKSKCLALLDQVNSGGSTITVTKRGRPIAVLSAAPKNTWKSPKGSWSAKGRIVGDIVNTGLHWDVIEGA